MAADEETDSADEDSERSRPPWLRSWATTALVVTNLSVFLAMVLSGGSLFFVLPADAMAAGGLDPRRVWDGEVWRLLSACFVHLGIWHLALNMWVLWQLGRALERMIGGAQLLLIYLSSGVFGFAASVAATAKPTAGASGAVFGVTGALLALALLMRHKELGRLIVDALLPFVIATFVLGLLVPMVDNAAHVGGLVFGFLLCFGLSAGDRRFVGEERAATGVSRVERVVGGLALVASALLFLAAGTYAARPIWSPLYLVQTGLAALQAGDIEKADAQARAAARIAPEDGATFILLGRLHEERGAAHGHRVEAVRLAGEGLRRYDDDIPDAFRDALIELALVGGGTEDLPFPDQRTVDLLCDAAVPLLAPAASGDAGAFARADLRNECAWLKLKSGDPSVHDATTGLTLARAAVAESEGKVASLVHTLAEAHAQTGNPQEALAILEKLAAEGRAPEMPGGAAFLADERRRVKQLMDEVRAAPVASPAAPVIDGAAVPTTPTADRAPSVGAPAP